MKLQAVLHFYLGCEFALIPKYNEGTRIDRMTSACPEHKTVYGSNGENYDYDAIKPILRPLSSMTEEEAVEVCKFATEAKRHKSIDILSIDVKRGYIHYMDGSMWSGDGVQEYNDLEVHFNRICPEQFHYLLSRGFDLFGLIPADLAINAKKGGEG
jgi:hypothetical protein